MTLHVTMTVSAPTDCAPAANVAQLPPARGLHCADSAPARRSWASGGGTRGRGESETGSGGFRWDRCKVETYFIRKTSRDVMIRAAMNFKFRILATAN